MDIEDEAAADLEVVEEVAFAADEDAVLFVDPDCPDDVADDAFEFVARLCVGVTGEVEDNGRAAVEVDAARVGEIAELEDAGCGEDGVAAGVGVFAFAFVFGATLFSLRDLLVDAIVFFLRFLRGEGLAVASYGAIDAHTVDGDTFGIDGDGFLDAAFAVEVLLLGVDVVGVVLARGF